MIIVHDRMVQIYLTANFKYQVLQWDGVKVTMKEPSGLIGKSDLKKREMRKVVMHTAEPDSKREATARVLKIFYINYTKADLKHVNNNENQMNAEERTQLLRILNYSEDLFDGT